MRATIIIVLVFLFLNSYSQTLIEVKYEKDNQGNYQFYCMNSDFCDYILEISFTQLINMKPDIGYSNKIEAHPGRSILFVLKPEDINVPYSFNYTYKYIKGCNCPKIKQDFVYLLPVASGKETEAFELSFFKINDQDPEPKDFYAIGIKMEYGDTVYSARRGIITQIRDTTQLNRTGYSFASKDNFIEIVHNDCSFGKYQVLSKVLVNVGQTVEAGEPIGLAGGDKYVSGSHVRFWVYYNFEQKVEAKSKDGTHRTIYWAYVPLTFYTKEDKATKLIPGHKYTSEHPDSLITQEMTKRQIKKWKTNKYQSL